MNAFEGERRHLFGVAYRMLGSASEAEDVLQEAWVRWSERREEPASTRAYLTTVVVRLCLDQLKSARARREKYIGPWLPEPLIGDAEPPDARTELAESLSIAFLVLLERLSPLERAAFLLHDVFDEPYASVARVLATSEDACRQLVARARAHIDENRPRFRASDEKKQELLQAFVTACSAGDSQALSRLLANDVVARSDGGGKVQAALKPIFGVDRVVRFIFGVLKKFPPDGLPQIVRVNGEPGLLARTEGGVYTVMTLTVDGNEVTDLWIVSNPDKLAVARGDQGPRG
ncbi:MAG: sigma-70 family RNA polymerase sigma factor [Polyangiaceae bacterium]|nr:sigma-70 family RNA polymerase sigma factor [Polyangiaceae bacterium]